MQLSESVVFSYFILLKKKKAVSNSNFNSCISLIIPPCFLKRDARESVCKIQDQLGSVRLVYEDEIEYECDFLFSSQWSFQSPSSSCWF